MNLVDGKDKQDHDLFLYSSKLVRLKSANSHFLTNPDSIICNIKIISKNVHNGFVHHSVCMYQEVTALLNNSGKDNSETTNSAIFEISSLNLSVHTLSVLLYYVSV